MWANREGMCKQETKETERVKTMAQESFWFPRPFIPPEHQHCHWSEQVKSAFLIFTFSLNSGTLLAWTCPRCVYIQLRQTAVLTWCVSNVSWPTLLALVLLWETAVAVKQKLNLPSAKEEDFGGYMLPCLGCIVQTLVRAVWLSCIQLCFQL